MVFSFAPNVLISHLRAALRFVSSDEARPEIACLRLEAHGREVRFLATDGYRLWVAAVDANEEAGVGAVHIARADAVRLMSKVLDKKSGTVRLSHAGGQLSVSQGTHASSFASVDLDKIEKSYPSFAHVFEPVVPADTPRAAVSVSGAYLADAAASFADVRPPTGTKDDKAKASSICILPGASSFAPITVFEHGSPAVMLIMPTEGESYEKMASFVSGLTERFSSAPVPSRRKRAG